jgi:hypothetical protein
MASKQIKKPKFGSSPGMQGTFREAIHMFPSKAKLLAKLLLTPKALKKAEKEYEYFR